MQVCSTNDLQNLQHEKKKKEKAWIYSAGEESSSGSIKPPLINIAIDIPHPASYHPASFRCPTHTLVTEKYVRQEQVR